MYFDIGLIFAVFGAYRCECSTTYKFITQKYI